MAVRLNNLPEYHDEGEEMTVATIIDVDTKADVIPNMKVGSFKLGFGSIAITNDFDVARLGSDGTWHWME